MADSTSSASVGSAAGGRRRAALILGLAVWVLAPAAIVGQDDEEAPSPRQKAEREIQIAEAAARRVQTLRRHPDFEEANRRDGGELQASLDRARRLIDAARDGLKSAVQRQSETAFGDAALLARRAARELAAYEEHVQDLFRQIEIERSPPPPPPPPPPPIAVAEPEAGPVTTEEAGATEPADAGEPPAAESAGEPPTAEPPTVEASPPPPVAPPPPTPRLPPRKLRQAADAYFAGDYEQAVALLVETRFSSRKARAHALMLRAAARYALFLLGGETDYGLRGLATEDVAACRRADPGLAPHEEMFSPRFRDFFTATR